MVGLTSHELKLNFPKCFFVVVATQIYICYVHPETWGRFLSILTVAYCSNGLNAGTWNTFFFRNIWKT